jgi:hypothetical protein
VAVVLENPDVARKIRRIAGHRGCVYTCVRYSLPFAPRLRLIVRPGRVEVEIRPPTDDDPLVIEYELPDAAAGGEIGFAFFNIEVRLPVNGRWVFVVTGGAGAFSLALVGEWLTRLAGPQWACTLRKAPAQGLSDAMPQMCARPPRSWAV